MFKKKNKEKKEIKVKNKLPFWKKFLIVFLVLFVLGVSGFVFLFYGPLTEFKEFWITSAMTTMSHKYLAYTFYDEETVNKVMSENYIEQNTEQVNLDDDNNTYYSFDYVNSYDGCVSGIVKFIKYIFTF